MVALSTCILVVCMCTHLDFRILLNLKQGVTLIICELVPSLQETHDQKQMVALSTCILVLYMCTLIDFRILLNLKQVVTLIICELVPSLQETLIRNRWLH